MLARRWRRIQVRGVHAGGAEWCGKAEKGVAGERFKGQFQSLLHAIGFAAGSHVIEEKERLSRHPLRRRERTSGNARRDRSDAA